MLKKLGLAPANKGIIMGISDLFSNRRRKLRGEVPEVYTYDTIPQTLRVQIIQILEDTLGNSDNYSANSRNVYYNYKIIVDTLCHEYGVFTLIAESDQRNRNYLWELANFILREKNTEKVLDSIELSFRHIDIVTRQFNYLGRHNAPKLADEAIEELNARFQEQGVGFQFTNGQIIRIDSKLIHSEVVKPALGLLHGKMYAGAQAEFLQAHEHYRQGKSKEALNECLKTLESTIKVICDKQGWKYPPNATSSALIKICFDNGLIPTFWEGHFSALRSTLESGVPTARNKLGGHGQGSTIVDVPRHLVAYVLHLTASCIVFLVESEKALP